jgi:ligand-binding sensor domain-containing protein
LKLLITSILLILASSLHSQNFKNYQVDQGLLSNEVFHVIQDRTGYIWIATAQGVNRYNGHEFEKFTQFEGLPGSTVLELYEDYKGRIWFIGLYGKLSWFENDSIYIYPYNDSIFKYNTQNKQPIKSSFYVDKEDYLYISTYDCNPMKVSPNGKINLLGTKKKNTSEILTLNSKETLLLCNKKASYFKLINPIDTATLIINDHSRVGYRSTTLKLENDYLVNDFNDLYKIQKDGKVKKTTFLSDILWISKANGKIWISFLNNGVKSFSDLSFNNCDEHFLQNQSVSSVCFDHENGLWITTLENGIYYTPSLEIKTLHFDNQFNQIGVRHMTQHKNKLFFTGGYGQYYTYDFADLDSYTYSRGKKSQTSKMLKFIGDSLIISDLMKGTYTIFEEKITNSPTYINDLIKVINGKLLVAYRGSIKYFNQPNIYRIKFKDFFEIYSMINFQNDHIWFGTDKGLYQYKISSKTVEKLKLNNTEFDRINILKKDSLNNIWIGTRGNGLYQYRNNTVSHYSTNDGLPGNSISSIIRDQNTLWVGTNKGVGKAQFNKDTIDRKSFITISKGHGLNANEVNAIEKYKGHIFVATNKGLNYFPANIKSKLTPIRVSSLSINKKDTTLLNEYNLPHYLNTIKIDFAAFNYQRNTPITYFYKLDGVDDDWRQTKDLSVQYSSLSPGSYSFRLKVTNSYGIENTQINPIRFIINKPIYKTLWFIILSSIISATLLTITVYYYFRSKLRTIKKRNAIERELNRSRQHALSAQMNPHFIYNSLNSVQYYILKNDPSTSNEYLSKLGDLMRRILDNSEHTTIPLKEEIFALSKYIELEQIRFHGDFEYEIKIDEKIDTEFIKVPPLIIQPYVENAIHHGLRPSNGKKKLKVHIFAQQKQIHIEIIDNGIGIEKAKELRSQSSVKFKSHGTNITHKRLMLFDQLYKNKMDVKIHEAYPESKENKGTKVEIKFISF